MKRLWMLPAIYVLVHTAQGDHVRAYEGQSQATITSLLTGEGKTGDFVSAKDYQAFIDSHPPRPTVPDPVKQQAIVDAKNASKSPQERIDALIKAIDLK